MGCCERSEKYESEWMQANSRVSLCTWSVFGIFCVAKGGEGLVLRLCGAQFSLCLLIRVGDLVPKMVHSRSVMAFVPFNTPY